MKNIVKIYARQWLKDNNISDASTQKAVIDFANEIDILLFKEVQDEKKN